MLAVYGWIGLFRVLIWNQAYQKLESYKRHEAAADHHQRSAETAR